LARKKDKFKTLKNKAPRIPDFTCPEIDNMIQLADRHFTKTDFKQFKRGMERLRKSNDRLRDSGRYWYEAFKKYYYKDKK